MDRSFEGLLFSVIAHAILVWIILTGHFAANITPPTAPTEVTLIEQPAGKRKMFVDETDLKPLQKKFEDQADMLSQFTKRVKQQMRARQNNAQTRNSPTSSPIPTAQRAAGQASNQERVSNDEGVGLPRRGEQNMRTLAIGGSSLSEFIPGVQEGAFTALNTDQFTYYTFFQRMNEQVRNRWVSLVRGYVNSLTTAEMQNLSTQDRISRIEIVLNSAGQFERAFVERSSGDKRLDGIHPQAFAVAAPFPNPPKGLLEADGKIHLHYDFLLQFKPPSFGPDIR